MPAAFGTGAPCRYGVNRVFPDGKPSLRTPPEAAKD
uniref:Uncharacterized protein n=1 Tax=Neisseria meningitidis alpha275 TaxID=295996 RepID=C6SL52_NEIME|nr:hypothetical protein predicted by Glimmer/Critica [Neisseria meningitidis alpha275]